MLPQVIHRAMGYLARREHASQELRDKLLRKGFDRETIDLALIQLRHDNLLSDQRFVESFVHSRLSKGHGPVRIEQELRKYGIDQDLLASSLNQYDAVYWQTLACQVRQKRFGQALPKTPQERAKQGHFLQYRGFNHEQIRVALQHGRID
jgi:regulatory protein